jgi:recombination protein RecT
MTTNLVKAKDKTTIQWLNDDNFKKSLANVLPKHLTAERMTRIALSELRNNQKLAAATPISFISAVLQASQLGLEPGVLGKCYLIPYYNNKTKNTDVQFMIGYRGMIELARRSGEIKSVYACEVDEADSFSYELGLEPKIVHVPSMSKKGKSIAYYAVAHFKDGGYQFEVMSLEEIESVRKSSKASESGPWMTHFPEMAKKTVLRRLFKWLPVSIELQHAITLDEQAEVGVRQHIHEKTFEIIGNNDDEENNETSFINSSDFVNDEITADGEIVEKTKTNVVLEQLKI